MAGDGKRKRENFGRIDQRSNGRWRARYVGPDKHLHSAPTTFPTKAAARMWLVQQQLDIAKGSWLSPTEQQRREELAAAEAARRNVIFGDYAAEWIKTRTTSKGKRLAERTIDEYERLIRPDDLESARPRRGGPLAELVECTLAEITPEKVRSWYSAQVELGTITQAAHAYTLLKSVLQTAIEDRLLEGNPCTIRGAASARTGKKVEPPTDDELKTIIDTINPRYKALIIVASNGSLRFGEATALRAKSLIIERDEHGDVDCVRLKIRSAVVRTSRERKESTVKSEAGNRELAIFGDDAKVLAEQAAGKTGSQLLFTAADGRSFLPQTTFFRHWEKARNAAGRPDLPFHGLRHYGGTRYAQAGATLKETMARLGHSSEKAAMRYQHSGNRDDELARRMAKMS